MQVEIEWTDTDPEEMADRMDSLADTLPEHLEAAVEEITLRVQADAQRFVNVDTGRLRSSIESVVEEVARGVYTGKVGSNVDYAIWQEIDTPYIRPAIEENRDMIVDRIEQAIEAAWEATA